MNQPMRANPTVTWSHISRELFFETEKYQSVILVNMKACTKPVLDNRAADDTPALLLILYEFEAKARLGSTDLEKILEQAIALPNADAKAFETIAGGLFLLKR